MALARRGQGGQRLSATIWPGFVDAMTALLMVLMFVLTIFMVVQSVLRETITTQDSELDRLGMELAGLSDALSGEQQRAEGLETELSAAEQQAADRRAELARMAEATAAQEAALANARSEIDARAEAARLAAARREALEALLEDMRAKGAATEADLSAVQEKLSEAEAAHLADAAAAQALRDKLSASETELTAMTLSLEEARAKAEETLTLLAAAEAAKQAAEGQAAEEASTADEKAALLSAAEAAIAQEKAMTAEEARKVALLNAQLADLRQKLGTVESALELSEEDSAAAKLEAEGLGQRLNAALLAKAEAEKQRATVEAERARLEEEARQKAEAEARDLARYKSEFFGRLSQILAGREGVKVVGDRFVFDSEVLFAPGEATLSPEGQTQIAGVAQMLRDVAGTIPPEIDWVIRVDGHTDDQPLSGVGRYRDNWELSQARALAVVRYMTNGLDFPADRLAATGFGEFRPAVVGDSPEARAANRRIELKLTER